MNFLRHCLFPVLGIALLAGACGAASAQSTVLRGEITDPSGAVIPGATISLTTTDGHTIATATSDASGAFSVSNLAPGTYIVIANARVSLLPLLRPSRSPPAKASCSTSRSRIAVEKQQVVVNEDTPTVSVDPTSNANSLVLKGKDLDALSDDPDELQNELNALAGPAAGPNGGQIYIDGFTAGQLPPKSAIREIRINRNPFSAEYDKLGYGRIEILTKPGTNQFHGQFFVQGNPSQFNTGNPFTKTFPTTTAINSTALSAAASARMHLISSPPSAATSRTTRLWTRTASRAKQRGFRQRHLHRSCGLQHGSVQRRTRRAAHTYQYQPPARSAARRKEHAQCALPVLR